MFFLSLLLAFPVFAEWEAKYAVVPGPCTCFWDQQNKSPAKITEGLQNKAATYNCGYVCQDAENKSHKVSGKHLVVFAAEYGNEVVCDGLNYVSRKAEQGPRGYVFVWDKKTHAFDPRFSRSKELQAWGHATCGDKILTEKEAERNGLTKAYMLKARREAKN